MVNYNVLCLSHLDSYLNETQNTRAKNEKLFRGIDQKSALK
jgi:hypothetical protein